MQIKITNQSQAPDNECKFNLINYSSSKNIHERHTFKPKLGHKTRV